MNLSPIVTIFLSIVTICLILFLSIHSAFDTHLFLQARDSKIHDKPSRHDFKKHQIVDGAADANEGSKKFKADHEDEPSIKVEVSKKDKLSIKKTTSKKESKHTKHHSSYTTPQTKKCKVKSHKSSCAISPRLLPYWSDEPDCFSSPLRRSATHASDPHERKYVVMQPDLGGWNNIRMALELGLLFAHVTGRIFVLPPPSVMYLLHQNKKWKDNFSTFADFLDFKRLELGDGLKTIPMRDFLEAVALPGLLSKPLPKDDVDLKKQPLWDYLESACYTRQWSPGKSFVVFNISEDARTGHVSFGDALDYSVLNASTRFQEFRLGREPILYDESFHSHRVVYFAGHEENRILMHFYGYLYFANDAEDRMAKRYARDRLRYVDEVYCSAGEVIDQLALLARKSANKHRSRMLSEGAHAKSHNGGASKKGKGGSNHKGAAKADSKKLDSHLKKNHEVETHKKSRSGKKSGHHGDPALSEARKLQNRHGTGNQYVAYHIRRGDFQHKHTQISADTILNNTRHLLPPDRRALLVYISTDEKNRSFFDPFFAEFGRVVFLQDFVNSTSVGELNANHVGMVEQLVCANAHTFIGCPLSTFTGYITRLRGYMNNTLTQWFGTNEVSNDDENASSFPPLAVTTVEKDIVTKKYVKKTHSLPTGDLYSRSYYYMPHQMHQLQLHPRLHPPYWVRDFTDAFADIDEPVVHGDE